jgi:hypothetical protein
MSDNRPYWQQRRDLKLGGKKPEPIKRQEKAAKGVYFASKIKGAPTTCENCGADLGPTKAINAAAIVCHILPKSEKNGCPSVALHPDNMWYGCIQCHTDYDNKGANHVIHMHIFNTLKERVAQFYNEIDPKERRRVPEYFLPCE